MGAGESQLTCLFWAAIIFAALFAPINTVASSIYWVGAIITLGLRNILRELGRK